MNLNDKALARFWAKVDKRPNGCWIWNGSKDHGHGRFSIGGRLAYAHRVAYELMVGPIPEGSHLDHVRMNANPNSCSKACVNPSHLEAVTPGENSRRSPSHREACSRNGIRNGRKNGIGLRKTGLPEGLSYTHGGKTLRARIHIPGSGQIHLASRTPVTPEAIAELSELYQRALAERDDLARELESQS